MGLDVSLLPNNKRRPVRDYSTGRRRAAVSGDAKAGHRHRPGTFPTLPVQIPVNPETRQHDLTTTGKATE